jgi:hypothetical protein
MKRSGYVACLACFLAVGPTEALAVKAVVVRSTGTIYLSQTIWPELNAGWSAFGDVPVQIDYTSLAGYGWSLADIEATGADVLILSNPAFFSYTADEINKIKQYVEAGHGLIISYGKFRSEDRALAPLVGLSETIQLGTGTAIDPFWLEPSVSDHPLFHQVNEPYVSGVPVVTTLWGAPPWPLQGGTVVAELLNDVIARRPGIVSYETDIYRGLYFAHYPEAKSGGSNLDDMQIFYNSILWTSVPEPAGLTLFLCGVLLLRTRRGRR